MTPAQIDAVIARQMPDAEKRRRADLVVNTGLSRRHAQRTLRGRLSRRDALLDMIRTVNPTDARAVGCLCRGLDLWAKVRGNLSRPVREVSTIRPNTA